MRKSNVARMPQRQIVRVVANDGRVQDYHADSVEYVENGNRYVLRLDGALVAHLNAGLVQSVEVTS